MPPTGVAISDQVGLSEQGLRDVELEPKAPTSSGEVVTANRSSASASLNEAHHDETARGTRLLWALFRLSRPKQMLKNLLVFAAPCTAGVLSHGEVVLRAFGAFAIFCLAAAGTYFLNDTFDSAADRCHPLKRTRPIAAGEVEPTLAIVIGCGLLALAVGLSWALAGERLVAVVGIYVAVSAAYSWRLKHEPVIDLA
ncbi:MAG: UbiA family prenyltransferase, partial [Acidimicrobiales bacterium]